MSLNIVGISALYHDSACCILTDGVLRAAAQEERFTRIKHDPAMPYKAFMFCLEQAGLSITDIDCVAYYESPQKKLSRQLWSGHYNGSEELSRRLDPARPEREIREVLGFEGLVKFYDHHQSHAASSFYYSGFDSSAILTVDGVGEWATTGYGMGNGAKLNMFEEVYFPHSIGLLYSTITNYLGFEINEGEYKVMGLAPYGNATYADQIRKLITMDEKGQFRLEMEYYDFIGGNKMYSEKLCELFGKAAREPESKMGKFHCDVAKSLQLVLEEVLLQKAQYLHSVTGSENLCMAGGVALNCVANGNILRKGPFKQMFVQPASSDSGCALGAAALAHVELTGERPQKEKLQHVYLGPSFGSKEIANLLDATSFINNDFRDDDEGLLKEVARLLADGKVIGWFHGREEFGPRSLGARSILADPRRTDMRDRINAMVKKREAFRPFAPAVLEEHAGLHFDLNHPSPFMLETCQVNSTIDLPAITHVDGSARVQTVSAQTNPRFHKLLTYFNEITGCPILLNTSFNVRGEPIVNSPEDALKCFITTDIDSLILEDFIISRKNNDLDLLAWMIGLQGKTSGIVHDVYTFI
ncbi:carbamoyltransferase [Mucilaginibacter sp. 21P]|uniref:carbamoyltransferase family protein n=1 Tax=Mucilaginibacter sp. 21P TaxID=2778902 RepID=UPI001C57EC68|nr:carbamoyltransferase N-terminal domain-containing protein [Mucilaginibacter sp. 21P]QXV63880.1 carbamoyltransferase [Mucilaginibacter sp. 21P]